MRFNFVCGLVHTLNSIFCNSCPLVYVTNTTVTRKWNVCVYMRVYACVCVYMRVYACICVYMRVCMYACICVYMRVYACMHVCSQSHQTKCLLLFLLRFINGNCRYAAAYPPSGFTIFGNTMLCIDVGYTPTPFFRLSSFIPGRSHRSPQ